MRVKEYLAKVAHIETSDISGDTGKVYLSNFDNSFITRVGMEDNVKFLADREITDELTHGVGFSPKDGKWYGWSHRAIYGFKIGSTCKKGDCHYFASNEADELEAAIQFWTNKHHINIRAKKVKDGLIRVEWKYNDKVKNKRLRNTVSGTDWYYDSAFGKGEWVAKTMEDAKQMAIDFNKGVS